MEIAMPTMTAAQQTSASCFCGALDGVESCMLGLGLMAKRLALPSLLPLDGVFQMFRVVLLVPYFLLVVVSSWPNKLVERTAITLAVYSLRVSDFQES